MSAVSSKMVPFPSSGDFSTKTEFGVWLDGWENKIFLLPFGSTRWWRHCESRIWSPLFRRWGPQNERGIGCGHLCKGKSSFLERHQVWGVSLRNPWFFDFFSAIQQRFHEYFLFYSCSRQLNFYDVFKKGMQKHGKEFLVWASTGRKKFVGVPDGTVQRIRCSDCGQETEASVGYATDVMSYNYYWY